jgi:hypothetical protein
MAAPASAGEADFLVAHPAKSFGKQYEALWQSAKDSFPITCGVVRSPDWLRYNSVRYLPLEVIDSRNGLLVGYSVLRTKPPLLCDILARRPASLGPVLAATLNWFATYQTHQDATATDEMGYLNAMETPALSPTLRGLGFTPVDYKFAFVCATLDPSLPIEALAPERWYITPGDHGP